MTTQTMTLNTLAQTSNIDQPELENHMVQFHYLNALRFLLQSRIQSFAETNDFTHYKQANILRTRINNILKGE